MRDWCKANDMSLRTPNQTGYTEKDRKKIATRCLGTLEEVAKAKKAECLTLKRNILSSDNLGNMDETAMRIFYTLVMTWHWKGAKNVPMAAEAMSKVVLSMPVMWFGDGSIEFVTVYGNIYVLQS